MHIKVGTLIYRVSGFVLETIQKYEIDPKIIGQTIVFGEVIEWDGNMYVRELYVHPTLYTVWIDEERLVVVDVVIRY